MEKPDYLPNKLKVKWLYALCPVCGKDYPYLPGHDSGHCGRFNCIYKLALKALGKGDES